MRKTELLLFSLFTLCLFAGGLTITILFNSAPDSSEITAVFFAALFVSLTGGLFFARRLVSYYRLRSSLSWNHTISTLRSSAIIALALILLLLFSSLKVLNLPSAVAVIIVAGLAELTLRRRLKSL